MLFLKYYCGYIRKLVLCGGFASRAPQLLQPVFSVLHLHISTKNLFFKHIL